MPPKATLFSCRFQLPFAKVFSKNIGDNLAFADQGFTVMDATLFFNTPTFSLNLTRQNPDGSTTVVMFPLNELKDTVNGATISAHVTQDMENANPPLILYATIKDLGVVVFNPDFISEVKKDAYLRGVPTVNKLQYG